MKNFLLGIVGVLSGLLISALVIFLVQPVKGDPIKIQTITPSPLMVYIDGAVISPGLYKMPLNARMEDVITSSGGLAADADLSNLNPAAKVIDGQKIHIPITGEIVITEPASPSNADRININTATLEELCELPGIGKSKASDIIRYHEEHGAFLHIRDILNVSGIGESIFDKIESMITID